MPSKKPIFTLRTEPEILEELHEIAQKEGRSDNKQLEYVLKKFISEYKEKLTKQN